MSEQRPFTAFSFNQYVSEGKLMASRRVGGEQVYVPPRAICPETYSDQMEWVALSGKGRLAAFTVVKIAPTRMLDAGYSRDNPYCSGIVELDEGAKISALILGVDATQPETIQIGTPLHFAPVTFGEGDSAETVLAFQVS